jgi:predicted small lipoprotein YifL
MKRILAFSLIGAALVALSACGYRGDLQRPPPRWGEAAEQHRQDAQQREEAEETEEPEQAQPQE